MNENSKIESLVETATEKIRELVDSETIVGKPVVTPDGTTIIPVSKVSVGFASGGSDLPTKNSGNFGGGSGAGITITPVAFIAIYNGEVKLLQLTANAPKENAIANMVPDVLDKVKDFLDKKSASDDFEE